MPVILVVHSPVLEQFAPLRPSVVMKERAGYRRFRIELALCVRDAAVPLSSRDPTKLNLARTFGRARGVVVPKLTAAY